MADDSSKPAIPAWQRAPKTEPEHTRHAETQKQDIPSTAQGAEEVVVEGEEVHPDNKMASSPLAEQPAQPALSTLSHVQAFLNDPGVKDASPEKKRAFLRSKDIPLETIEQVLRSTKLDTNDFHTFQQSQPRSQSQQMSQPTASAAPPIITYPEFLVEAHKPPPLITPTRVLYATYFSGGLALLSYGLSKFVMEPMRDTMTERRHEFATHSLSKIEEMNERLSKLVSRVPEKARQPEDEVDGAESITSDPTELFHRDMGTQTSEPESLPASPSLPGSQKEQDPVEYQIRGLGILRSHLEELLDANTQLEESNKEAQDGMNRVRHYLDTVMYGGMAGMNSWGGASAFGGEAEGKPKDKEDVFEELKKEIRGVKGVLLSARRFPAVGGVVGRSGTYT